MLCYFVYVKYTDYLRQIPTQSETDIGNEDDTPIENKTLIFNPNCFIGIIFDYLLDEIRIPKELKGQIDLVDERSRCLEINKIHPATSGLDVLTLQTTYFFIRNEEGSKEPILASNSPLFINFYTNLSIIKIKPELLRNKVEHGSAHFLVHPGNKSTKATQTKKERKLPKQKSKIPPQPTFSQIITPTDSVPSRTSGLPPHQLIV